MRSLALSLNTYYDVGWLFTVWAAVNCSREVKNAVKASILPELGSKLSVGISQ